jgi:hypothetical protein
MKFFKPEDFAAYDFGQGMDPLTCAERLARVANNKLERFGEIVYGNFGINNHNEITHVDRNPAHKALLINIEEVHKCPTEYVCSGCGKEHRIVPKLIKDDLGPDASKTYKDDLFEDCAHSTVYYDLNGGHYCKKCKMRLI